MAAAAVAGGSLTLIGPVATLATAGSETDTAAVVALASDKSRTTSAGGDGVAAVPAGYASTPADDLRVIAGIEPVAHLAEPEPDQVDAAALLKAVGLADVVRRAEEERAAREAAARCDIDLDGLGRVKPWVSAAAQFLGCLYGQPDLIGVAGRGRVSDHPSGHALDFMVRGEQGDRIAECALRNQKALGITYVIWEQRINYGDGWQRMEDRGGDTENHVDHVHISFAKSPPAGTPSVELCG
ncbi:hypothetical protein ACVGVM_22200 [Pseudonocardia bannensis]|uniref:ARB-07466-like C-terminal domain-containing protein n=1 Tax=Pseudonocardia bannensis TaxID=630973 RepID=A0A848DH93_9PSEU|nr:hypothetical protein [Pseudonocardia bannensis]NMH91881.1 hypothetical protein [Pseudonocardia bannensis]